MKKDAASSLFWLLLAIYCIIESYRFGLGQLGMPGPGYFPFGAGVLFGGISLAVMISSFRKAPKEIARDFPERLQWRNIVLILGGMLAYVLCFHKVGFILGTFLIVVFFIRLVAHDRWSHSIVIALSITVAFYFFFDFLLNAQLPLGPFSFLRG